MTSIDNVVSVLHQAHIDNCRRYYYASEEGRPRISQMPAVSFIYEFFIYNSIYSVDWKSSKETGIITYYPDHSDTSGSSEASKCTDKGMTEGDKQKELEKFLKPLCREKPDFVYRAFLPLLYFTLDGDWTKVVPDTRIKQEDGQRFFKNLRSIQTLLREASQPQDIKITGKFFDAVKECRRFVYLVRNNIFHGSKNLGEISEASQKRRISVYDLFLKSLNSLFFLIMDHKANGIGVDYIQIPVPAYALPRAQTDVLSQDQVLQAVNRREMKAEDARLIALFTKEISPTDNLPDEEAALFYPSAGGDILTPVILGLPYCQSFYFYEINLRSPSRETVSTLRTINGVRGVNRHWKENHKGYFLDFEYRGVQRTICHLRQDNRHFLDEGKHLAFYFHRGDSWGEGGSGQRWDSELLPHLIKLIPEGKDCVFLTGGEPGGLHPILESRAKELTLPMSQRKNYFIGRLEKSLAGYLGESI